MLKKQRLTHPEILDALAAAGHGAKVLITDGNYPASTKLGENAVLTYLNLAPGKPTVTEVLDHLESRGAIQPDDLARCRAYWGEYGTEEARAWATQVKG